MIVTMHVGPIRSNSSQTNAAEFLVNHSKMLKSECESSELYVARVARDDKQHGLFILLDYADVPVDCDTGRYLSALAKHYCDYWGSEYGLDIEYIGEGESIPEIYFDSILSHTATEQQFAAITAKKPSGPSSPGF